MCVLFQADYIYSDSEEELDKFNPSQISIYVLLSVFLALSVIGIIIQIIFLERAPAKFDKPNSSHEKEKKLLGGKILLRKEGFPSEWLKKTLINSKILLFRATCLYFVMIVVQLF